MIAELTLRDACSSGGNLTRSHDGKASGLVLRPVVATVEGTV